uniref:Uncharacterized protein n=1 Tax=Myotis myotis TaxID=51298 RepID=A0A7J7VYX2_MYOMY|nr:hypothetical protein mMyoMyo1_012251 [Myotis myotis]
MQVPCPSYGPSHPHSSEVPPLSPSHTPLPIHPDSAQPLLTWLLPPVSTYDCRSHTNQVTPLLRPLHGSLLPSISFKGAPRTTQSPLHAPRHLPPLATHDPAISTMCCFQAGRPPPPATPPTHLLCKGLLQQDSQGQPPGPDIDPQRHPGPLGAWGGPATAQRLPQVAVLCCRSPTGEKRPRWQVWIQLVLPGIRGVLSPRPPWGTGRLALPTTSVQGAQGTGCRHGGFPFI